jgi:hypothetical protein
VSAYGRLSAAELSDIALQLEDIRQKLARGGVGYSSSDELSVQVSVVEELAARQALKELRDRQQVEKANNQREQARKEAEASDNIAQETR